MKRFVVPFAALAVTLVASLPAHAQLTRTFVSSSGIDTNPCTIAAPCASFARAYSLVASNGIVAALDPGKYGPLTITGPVTIDGNGWAAITVPSRSSGIKIRAGTSDNIILRGLEIDGAGGGFNGIEFDSGASLTVTGCIVRNLATFDGLDFYNTGSSAETLTVADSQFINNGVGQGGSGVLIQTQSTAAITASFVRTLFTGNDFGLQFTQGLGPLNTTVTDSVAANNGQAGFFVAATMPTANLNLTKDQIANNAIGIQSNNEPTIWLAQSTVFGNTTAAFQLSGGLINSYGNNYFAGNNDSGDDGSLTPVGAQ
jgi:hypothetical protein